MTVGHEVADTGSLGNLLLASTRYGCAMAGEGVVVWYNPRCSKCRGAEELLAAYGVSARRVRYLDDPPSAAEITRVLTLLGAADPRVLMRTSEPRYEELGLADATVGELIDAMASHPELIERPVVIWADRAVIARPPELLLPLLGTGQNPALP
jgi:arsenate reductase